MRGGGGGTGRLKVGLGRCALTHLPSPHSNLIEADTRKRLEMLEAGRRERAPPPSLAAPPPSESHGRYAGAAAVGRGGPRPPHLRFSMDAAPPVISPLCSPLVVRAGLLLRQSGLIKAWRQSCGVLTRDGFLHVFQTDADDLATHTELLTLLFKHSAERRVMAVGGGGARAEGPP